MEWTATRSEAAAPWVVEAAGRRVEVPVPPGPGVLAALDLAARAALGVAAAAPVDPPRWRLEVDRYQGGGLFELEERTTWQVVEVATGRVHARLTAESSASYDGVGWSGGGSGGVDEVALGSDGAHLLVREGGRAWCEALPRGQGGQAAGATGTE